MAISAGAALVSTAASGVTFSAAAGFGFSMGLTTFATKFLVSTAIGVAINALTPKPQSPKAQGYTVTARGSNLDHQIIYGKTRVGGVVTSDFLSGEGGAEGTRFLHRVQVMAGHEVESYEEIYMNSYKVSKWQVRGADVSGDQIIDDVTDITPYVDQPFNILIPVEFVEVASDGTETVVEDLSYKKWRGLAMQFWTGADDQTASTKLIADIPNSQWTSNHRLRGRAYIYIRMGRDAEGDNFPTGVPDITAVIKGRKVYDPRKVAHDAADKSTWEWSSNPALCARDYLTQDFGLGEKDIQVDDTLVATAANVCDSTVDDGSTLYTCNGSFTTGIQPYDFLNSILTSMGGLLWYAQGQWRMKPAYWTSPTESFNEDDLRSTLNVSTRHSRRDNFNTVQGSFRGPQTNYAETTYPAVTSAASVAADGGIESSIDLEMPFTDTFEEARRIARIVLERNRQQVTIKASFGLRAFRVQVGDVVNLSLERFGWVNKTFEVTEWSFGNVDQYDIQVELTLREITEAVFDEVDDGVTFEVDNANVPSPLAGLTVSNLTATAGGFTATDGTFVPNILVDWDSIVNSNVAEYIVEWGRAAFNFADYGGEVTDTGSFTTREQFIFDAYNDILSRNPDQSGFDFYNTGDGSSLSESQIRLQLQNSPESRAISGSVRVGGETTEYTISPAADDSMYSIRVKAINDFGTSSNWTTATVNVGKDGTTPSEPTSLSAVGGFQSSTLAWLAPTTNTDSSVLNDLFEYNIYRAFVNSFGSSTLVGSTVGKSYVDSGLADNTTYYYWVTAQDYSGNESSESNSASATTNFISAAEMVADIRDEIGAARIDRGTSLPSTSGYSAGDYFYRTSTKELFEFNGSSFDPVESGTLKANSVVAGTINTSSASADILSATQAAITNLAAIKANLGEVTAGSINTLSGGVGLQVNVSGKPRAVYSYQNSTSIYGLFAQNIALGGGTMEIRSNGGFTSTFLNSNISSGAFGPFVAVNAQNTGTGGGHGQAGVSLAGGGYAFRSIDGGFYDVGGDGYNPFTGRHDGMISKSQVYDLGDIVVDSDVIVRGLSDSFTELQPSTFANDPSAVGVVAKVYSEWYVPASFVDSVATRLAQDGHTPTPDTPMAPMVTTHEVSDYEDDYDLVNINAVGEGAVNVCGEGGNISKGDLIVTSSAPGKGMKQSDDIVRSYTVAKAREDITFADPTEVKMVACIYLCG